MDYIYVYIYVYIYGLTIFAIGKNNREICSNEYLWINIKAQGTVLCDESKLEYRFQIVKIIPPLSTLKQ